MFYFSSEQEVKDFFNEFKEAVMKIYTNKLLIGDEGGRYISGNGKDAVRDTLPDRTVGSEIYYVDNNLGFVKDCSDTLCFLFDDTSIDSEQMTVVIPSECIGIFSGSLRRRNTGKLRNYLPEFDIAVRKCLVMPSGSYMFCKDSTTGELTLSCSDMTIDCRTVSMSASTAHTLYNYIELRNATISTVVKHDEFYDSCQLIRILLSESNLRGLDSLFVAFEIDDELLDLAKFLIGLSPTFSFYGIKSTADITDKLHFKVNSSSLAALSDRDFRKRFEALLREKVNIKVRNELYTIEDCSQNRLTVRHNAFGCRFFIEI